MIIIGVDFHPEFQQIASVDTDTGEFQEKRLTYREEAEQIYRALACEGQKVRVGMEPSRHAPWASRRRRDLLELLDRRNPTITELSQAIQQEVEKCPEARRLIPIPVLVRSPHWPSC